MRKPLMIAGIVVGGVIIAVVVVLLYAVMNLNSLIAERQSYVLDRVSTALGRDVKVATITATLGWGVAADLKEVKIAEDPAISDKPFVEAGDVYASMELAPLLARQLKVTRVTLKDSEIRIIKTREGALNVASIGKREKQAEQEEKNKKKARKEAVEGTPMQGSSRKSAAALGAVSVQDISIEGGKIVYRDEQAGGPPIKLTDIDLNVTDFGFDRQFDTSLKFAALSTEQNVDIDAKVGPLIKEGTLDPTAMPVSVKVKVGPLAIDQLKSLPAAAKAIPPQLSITAPLSFDADASGTLRSITFDANSDLTANGISFGDSFNKPSGTTLKVAASGTRIDNALELRIVQVALADLDLKATNIKTGQGRSSARVDTNRFDIASLGKFAPALAKLNVTGRAEIHSGVLLAGKTPSANGVVALDQVAVTRPGQSTPIISAVTGNVNLAGNSADIGPLDFRLGSSSARLKAHADSIQPVRATYEFSADAIKLAELAPGRPADEQLTRVTASGSAAITPDGPDANTRLTSASGNVANVPFNNLSLDASLRGKQATIKSLKVGAFSGSLAAAGNARLEDGAPFDVNLNTSSIDLQQALQSQQSKMAGIIRGQLTGTFRIAGNNNGTFDRLKPTLNGNGRMSIANGKLVGVNIGADALKKVNNLPAIGALVPDSVVQNHPELFSNPDTDIQQASLTFQLQGPRITTHDLMVQTVDYSLLGDGWFDMDKNIDLGARIVLSRPFSQEIIAQKRNVVYVANSDGQVDIPLQVTGQLPKPRVLPDVTILAQRATQQAVQQQSQKYIGKYLGKQKGVGGLLGGILGGGTGGNTGDGGGGAPGGSATPVAPNPFAPLQKLF